MQNKRLGFCVWVATLSTRLLWLQNTEEESNLVPSTAQLLNTQHLRRQKKSPGWERKHLQRQLTSSCARWKPLWIPWTGWLRTYTNNDRRKLRVNIHAWCGSLFSLKRHSYLSCYQIWLFVLEHVSTEFSISCVFYWKTSVISTHVPQSVENVWFQWVFTTNSCGVATFSIMSGNTGLVSLLGGFEKNA